MKKKHTVFIVFIIVFAVIVMSLLAMAGWMMIFSIPKGNPVTVDGNIIDNEYNNFISGGQFCRLGDKLYFNFEKTRQKNGLIEISENGAKRIFRKRNKLFSAPYFPANDRIFTNNEKLFKIAGNKWGLQCYDDGFKDVLPLEKLKNLKIHKINKFFCHNDEIFFCATDNEYNQGPFYLVAYKNGEFDVLIENSYRFYGTENNKIYYQTEVDDKKWCFYEYDISTGKSVSIYQPSKSVKGDFIVENNCLICILFGNGETELATLDLLHPDKGFRVIDKEDYSCKYTINSFNAFDNNVYISSNDGLFVYNLDSKKRNKIVGGDIKSSYIVDDKYVYYVKTDETLWRITKDKRINEKVYG